MTSRFFCQTLTIRGGPQPAPHPCRGSGAKSRKTLEKRRGWRHHERTWRQAFRLADSADKNVGGHNKRGGKAPLCRSRADKMSAATTLPAEDPPMRKPVLLLSLLLCPATPALAADPPKRDWEPV